MFGWIYKNNYSINFRTVQVNCFLSAVRKSRGSRPVPGFRLSGCGRVFRGAGREDRLLSPRRHLRRRQEQEQVQEQVQVQVQEQVQEQVRRNPVKF